MKLSECRLIWREKSKQYEKSKEEKPEFEHLIQTDEIQELIQAGRIQKASTQIILQVPRASVFDVGVALMEEEEKMSMRDLAI